MELAEDAEEQDAGGDDEDYPEGLRMGPGEVGGGGSIGLWGLHADLVCGCCIWAFSLVRKENRRE